MKPFVPRKEWDPGVLDARPELGSFRRAARPFVERAGWPVHADLDAEAARLGVTNLRGQTVRFAAATKPPPGTARSARDLYDGRILLDGIVPTRLPGYHDFFNALAWLAFPRAKARVNARQFAAAEARLPRAMDRLPGARSREQDALAMLDEGGLLILASAGGREEAQRAVEATDLEALVAMVARGAVAALLFGHALAEHVVSSDAPIRALATVLGADGALPAGMEARVAHADGLLAEALADDAYLAAPPPWRALALTASLFGG